MFASKKMFIVEFVSIFGILFHLFGQSEQKPVPPVGSFVQLFDLNHDGKVEIGTEIPEYYDNIVKLQNILSAHENGTNLEGNQDGNQNGNGTDSTGNVLRGIPLEEYRQLFNAAQNTLINQSELSAADVDGDGLLNIGEQANFTATIAAKYFDINRDGFVDGNESRAYDAKVAGLQFKEFDANHDGKLDANELKALVHALSGPLSAIIASVLPPKRDLRLEEANELLAQEYGLKPAQIKAADVDANGNLTFKEFLDHIGIPLKDAKQNLAGLHELISPEMVEKADKNGDGFLDYGELINLLTVDAAIKLGDKDGDGTLNTGEFVEGFEALQAYYLGLHGGGAKKN